MNADGPSTRIRPATAEDIDEVFALATTMALTFAPERTAFDASYAGVLDDPHAHLLVADVDEVVVGYLLAFEHVAFFANGSVAWVEELAVRSDLRRRGLGAMLIGTYEQSVRRRGVRLVALATTRAGAFYAALGYADHAAYYRKLIDGPPLPDISADAGSR